MQALDVARRRAWHSGDTDVSAETSPRVPRTEQHLDTHGRSQAHGHEPPPALSRADALVAVAESFLSTEAETRATRGPGAAPIELIVHVDEAALRVDPRTDDDPENADSANTPDPTRVHATVDDGTAIPVATAQRFACDAAVAAIAEDAQGNVRTLTRRTRRISSILRRALRVRDDGCRFPGCANRLTDAHHVVAWARGGATHLANLCSLCRRHHRIVHEHGYRIERDSDGVLRFFRRDGSLVPAAGMRPSTTITTRSNGAGAVDADPLAALRAAHAARGLAASDGHTAFPRWDGTPVDYSLAVQALLGSELADPGTGATGWTATAIRSGRSGTTSAAGGRSAICRTCASCTSAR